jgi:hypothetical protein
VVLAQVEELKDVGVPRLEVDGKRAGPLVAALVDVARRVVEDAQHGHDAVRRAVGAADVRARRADAVDVEPDAAGRLADHGARLERVVDALDAVGAHVDEEARRQLRLRRAGVEERRRRVREELARHEVVRLERALHVVLVDADGHAHEHVLRPLGDLAVQAQQVRALERLEAEVLVVEVAVVHNRRVELVGVPHHHLVRALRDHGRLLPVLRVDVVVQVRDDRRELLLRLLVQVRHRDARRQDGVVGVRHRHIGSGFGGLSHITKANVSAPARRECVGHN